MILLDEIIRENRRKVGQPRILNPHDRLYHNELFMTDHVCEQNRKGNRTHLFEYNFFIRKRVVYIKQT